MVDGGGEGTEELTMARKMHRLTKLLCYTVELYDIRTEKKHINVSFSFIQSYK